jgi:hypothetical protein
MDLSDGFQIEEPGAVRVGRRPTGSTCGGASARSVVAPPTGFRRLTGDAISTLVTVGRRYYNRARFGDSWVTPSQLAPASLIRVGTLHLEAPFSRGFLCASQLQGSQRRKSTSAAVRLCSRLLHETCGLVPMAAAGELVAAASADGQHSTDD